jgi:hypothetical protein
MIDIKELKLFLANNFGNTGQINIQYRNQKPDFVGYVHKMNDETLDFTMMKMTTKQGENPYFDIDFENIQRIEIKIQGTTNIKVFE